MIVIIFLQKQVGSPIIILYDQTKTKGQLNFNFTLLNLKADPTIIGQDRQMAALKLHNWILIIIFSPSSFHFSAPHPHF